METSQRFFLSYARADNGQFVRRFFEDLSDTIRDGLNLSGNEQVGFYEEIEYGPTSTWTDGGQEALQSSRVMVSLLSPSYLRSERCGKEWQIFERRRRLHLKQTEGPENLAQRLDQVIVPVTWISCPGPIPRIVSEILAHPDHLFQARSMMTMFRSAAMFKGEYSELVKSLASQIIETMETKLLPLESLPKMNEEQSAFQLWDEIMSTLAGPRTRPQSNNDKANHSDAPFVKGGQLKERATTSSDPGAESSSSSQPPSTSASETEIQIKNYSVLAISKSSPSLDEILQCCRFAPDIDLDVLEDPQQAMNLIDTLLKAGEDLPELFVIDLDMGKPVVDIITRLNKSTSPVVGLSVIPGQGTVHKVIALTPTLPKPPNRLKDLIKQIRQLAKTGRDCAVHHRRLAHDKSRKRQVFLSYSSEDIEDAESLRQNLRLRFIEVSYSPEIQTGKEWEPQIRSWIAEAQVFLALITNGYLKSEWCKAEFTGFSQRPGPKTLMPIYYNSPDTRDNRFIEDFVKQLHRFDMSQSDFRTDKIDQLAQRIHNALAETN